jgi:hypothetical protein
MVYRTTTSVGSGAGTEFRGWRVIQAREGSSSSFHERANRERSDAGAVEVTTKDGGPTMIRAQPLTPISVTPPPARRHLGTEHIKVVRTTQLPTTTRVDFSLHGVTPLSLARLHTVHLAAG